MFRSHLHLDFNDNGGLDLHRLSHGTGYISVLIYIENIDTKYPLIVITGIGNHERNEKYAMRDYVQNKLKNNVHNIKCKINEDNEGQLILTQVR